MDDLYREIILDHYKHPRNKGTLEGEGVILVRAAHASCGDDLRLMVALDGDRIGQVSWDGEGCAISQAAMSLLSEEILGKTLQEIAQISRKDVLSLLGMDVVAPGREGCTYLCLDAIAKLPTP